MGTEDIKGTDVPDGWSPTHVILNGEEVPIAEAPDWLLEQLERRALEQVFLPTGTRVCRDYNIPEGWLWRTSESSTWSEPGDLYGETIGELVEVRPA